MMELKKYGENWLVTYQHQGNNKNGNPIFLINVFEKIGDNYHNINARFNKKLDKYDNLKIVSYNIESDIKFMLDSLN